MERLTLGPLSCLVKRARPGAPVLVCLHGRGASAEDLADVGDAIAPEANQVYPDAPRPWPSTGRPVGLAWYDSGPGRASEIADSRAKLVAALAAVRAEVSGGPLILLGFSQGALMTMDTGLREGSPEAGDPAITDPGLRPGPARLLIALSGYLHEPLGGPESPPLLIVHGTHDDVVPVEKGRDAHAALKARGVRVTYEEFPMTHEITPTVVRTVAWFIAGARLQS